MQITDEQRLMLIAAAMNGILANCYSILEGQAETQGTTVAEHALYYADSVICKLEREDDEGGEINAAQTEALEPE